MDLTLAAEWLNNTFYAFDKAILGFWHGVAEGAGGALTPLMRFVTLIGEKGLLMFLLAFLLLCFPKTRRIGVCVFGAVCCGALITNLVLKDFVARPRPFETDALFREWWIFLGSPAEDGFSFPSGHTTAAMAGITALVMSGKKPALWLGYIYVVLIAISRNYLMAHYPSDVLTAILVGLFSAAAAYVISLGIFAFLEKHRKNAFCAFVLDFDPRRIFSGNRK